jgi:hypothetical protein
MKTGASIFFVIAVVALVVAILMLTGCFDV